MPRPPSLERISLSGGGLPLEVTVVRSDRRQKSISLQVGQPGHAVVRAPSTLPLARVSAFVARREAWLRARLDALARIPPAPPPFAPGRTLLYLGRELPLHVTAAPGTRISVALRGDGLTVALPGLLPAASRDAAIRAALERWYRARAAELLPPVVAKWASLTGRSPASILVRGQRSRWGSCSAAGVIRLNYRLAMLPPAVTEYVVLHELVHLEHPNHGPGFWAELQRHMPDARARRRSLRELSPACIL